MTAWFRTLLLRWVEGVLQWPRATLLGLLLLSSAAGWIATTRFAIDSDLSGLIDQNAPWRVDFDRYAAAFPDRVDTLVLVVRGARRSEVERAGRDLVSALQSAPEVFQAVRAPALAPFFREHALLYLPADELEVLIDRLASAQPLLAAVAQQPRLEALLGRLTQAVEAQSTTGPDRLGAGELGLAPLLTLLGDSARALHGGGDPAIAWRDELLPETEPVTLLITARAASVASPDEGAKAVDRSNAEVMTAARGMLAELALPPTVTVALTGEIALAHEEIEAATTGVARAGWLSLAGLLVVLLIGVRSLKVIGATFLLLLFGVVWTTAFAMLTVGSFNTLSIVFLVMFFGLGVDFAVHYALRYQEALAAAADDTRASRHAALRRATASVGPAIGLCALTTGVAFLSFAPTEYRGLADLGVISAGGMLIAALLTFTLLPAFFALAGTVRTPVFAAPRGSALLAWLLRRRREVLILTAVAALLGSVGTARSHFDFSVLALRDEASPSMVAFRRLQREGLVTDYSLALMTPDPAVAGSLAALPVVGEVETPQRYLPEDQTLKALLLEDAGDLFWDLFEGPVRPVGLTPAQDEASRRRDAVMALQQALSARGGPADRSLATALARVGTLPDAQLARWEHAVLDDLLAELAWLERALAVDPVTFEDLPADLRAQLRSAAGDDLLLVNPAQDVTGADALQAFVEGVRAVAPTATGRPVIEWGVGQIVVRSFRLALALALGAVLLILWLRYRQVRTVALILLPLMLAGLLTLAVGHGVGVPINMASVLVLPLIFGLGVDNGIHVVDRHHSGTGVLALAGSSTPRAVLLSTLTTIGAFASLMLSPHQGTASIGLLLTVAVSAILLLTLFLLPVLLSDHSDTTDRGVGASG
ncbi:MAG: MMPL family transporter [Pseudomonadota bacterium]